MAVVDSAASLWRDEKRDAHNERWLIAFMLLRNSCGRANELTLSCKNRPPCGAHRGAVAAATERASEGAKCGRRAAVQFEAAPRRLRRRASGPAVFVSL